MTQEEFEEYVNVNHDVEVTGELTDAELLQAVQKKSGEAEESDENEDIEPPPLSLHQKMKLVDYFRQFIQEKGMQTALPIFKQVESMVFLEAAASMRQRTMDFYCT